MRAIPQQAIDALVTQAVQRHAARPAVTGRGATLTYGELGTAIDRLALRLADAGVRAGERVAIVAPNLPCSVAAVGAIWRVGAVAVPLNARLREYDLGRALRDAEPSAVVCVSAHQGYSFAELLRRLLPELASLRRCLFVDAFGELEGTLDGHAGGQTEELGAETALILYTSGSTGAPKGALIGGEAEVVGAREMNDVLAASPADVTVFVVPVSHAFGLTCLLASLAAGSHAVMVDSTFSLERTLEAIGQHRATVLHGSPVLFTELLKAAPRRLTGLRTGFVAGSACPAAVLERLDGLGVRILHLYGMTELGAITCVRSGDPPAVRYSTVGRPLSGFELRIDPEADHEVQVRGPYVTAGYFRRPAETSNAFAGEWFRTGDIGSLDERGNLMIAGRAKELIKVSGLNVFPAEVEGLLLTHPDVVQAAVIGVPHEITGEALRAFVVARAGSSLTPSDLLRFARARIAGYKLPYAIDLVADLPTLSSGKPDRVALRRSLQEAARVER